MKEILQFGYVNIEEEKIYSVKLSDEQKEQLGFNEKKHLFGVIMIRI